MNHSLSQSKLSQLSRRQKCCLRSFASAYLGIGLIFCALATGVADTNAQGSEPKQNPGLRPPLDQKTILLFSMDQGFGNGVVANGDIEGVSNMVRALVPLQDKYRVCVLLNPLLKDKARFKAILDTLVAQKMPFVFDVYTSDAYNLGPNCAANEAFDASHGLSISVDQLAAFKKDYGKWLVGLRFMEVFGQDFMVRTIKTGNHPDWGRPGDKIPVDNVFSPDISEGYIRFAREHNMFVQWADFGWGAFAPWDKEMPKYEQQVIELLRKYPGVVTVTYNNNEPDEASLKHLDIWQTAVERFKKEGAAGFGLSNQSWLRNFHHMETTPEEIIQWTQSAMDKGCPLIQFEPAWYFFNLPIGSFDVVDYSKDAKWKPPGAATESLKKLSAFLLAPNPDQLPANK